MRVSLLLLLALLVAEPARPQQQQDQLDSNISVFTVLTAVNAGGYDAEIHSGANHPLRQFLRDRIAAQKLDSVFALKRFVRDHKKQDPAAELSQYISYALTLNGPPDFSYRYQSQTLPPDVAALDGLTPLLIAFYREAHIEELWKSSQPYFDQAIAKIQAPVAQAVLQVNAYLRNPTSGYLGRRFQIYVDLLGAPNQVQSRSYVDDYFVVVTPSADPPTEDIRHAYLHYLADPLLLKFSTQMRKKHALGDYAQGAPALEDTYKSDFILFSTECFIKAVESRIDRKPAVVDQATREGFVLTAAFADQLAVYEKQDRAMRLYFPDLVDPIDLKREEKRLENIEFVSARAVRKIKGTPAPQEKPVELSGPEKRLDAAEEAYKGRDLDGAKKIFVAVLQEPVEKPLHAKAYYGLARIAVLERDPELGDRLFRKVLELEPDAATKSWSFLYLGRLADSQGDREQAQDNYKSALAVEGAPDSVREAAEKGLKEAFAKK